ncbi:patatin-like phospholipase family protein [Nocardia stercoris]|uniref:patatin-like phospholipase family protein n=1 Tax=Nocardia stercoris TaxID=2483361 RepID=UPI001319F966|nr:patatin-like phospholipase family protein [Nocardia stercoris]
MSDTSNSATGTQPNGTKLALPQQDSSLHDRALVLGPGGPVGTAWLLGLAAGLRKQGIDLGAADAVVGTSAGAIAAVLLTRGVDLFDHADPTATSAEKVALVIDPAAMVAAFGAGQGLADGDDPVRVRQEIGRIAKGANTSPATERIERFAAAYGTGPWPHPGLLIPTVGAEAGVPVVWSAADDVPAHLAVTASTAMPGLSAPIPIGDRTYYDGAFRNGSNADLVAAAKTLVLIEPMAHLFPTPAPEGPATVLRIGPDTASRTAIGPDLNDMARWPATFAAGLDQAESEASALRAVWN